MGAEEWGGQGEGKKHITAGLILMRHWSLLVVPQARNKFEERERERRGRRERERRGEVGGACGLKLSAVCRLLRSLLSNRRAYVPFKFLF